eukprot:SAG11_NODE_7088_length_1195_cov_155.105839_1_plen_105_part_10
MTTKIRVTFDVEVSGEFTTEEELRDYIGERHAIREDMFQDIQRIAEDAPIEETDTEEIGRAGLWPFTVIRGDNHDFQEYLLDIYSTKVYEKGTSEGSVGKEVGIF